MTKLDRWSRDVLFFVQSSRDIAARGATFLSLAERFDPSTPEGRYAATMMAAGAEHEHARIKARTVGRRRELRAQGCWIEGPAPFGYRVERRHLVMVPVEAELVREAYRRCIAGESISTIGSWLRELGAGRGGPQSWSKKTVHNLLRARWYMGQLETVPGVWKAAHEPLVDVATHQRAQAALGSRKLAGMTARSDSRTASWLGRGLLSCSSCGARMGPAYRTGATELHYYVCGTHVRKRSCDAKHFHRVEAVDAQLDALTRARLLELRHELGKGDPPQVPDSRVEELRARAVRLAAKRSRTIDLLTDGTIAPEDGRARLAKIDEDLSNAAVEISTEEARVAGSRPEVRREVLRDVRQLERAWKRTTVAERRSIIGQLAERLDLDSAGQVRASWKPVEELARSKVRRS